MPTRKRSSCNNSGSSSQLVLLLISRRRRNLLSRTRDNLRKYVIKNLINCHDTVVILYGWCVLSLSLSMPSCLPSMLSLSLSLSHSLLLYKAKFLLMTLYYSYIALLHFFFDAKIRNLLSFSSCTSKA